jgi:hypothetical protein
MKKVISVATTAAMTLSMLSVPAIVLAAEDTAAATTSVNFVVKDQSIAKGLTSFTVPFSVSKGTTLTSAELKLSAEMFIGGSYYAKISGVKSNVDGLKAELKDGTVTISGSAAVKKGEDIFSVTVDITDKAGNPATSAPANTSFILKVDSAKIGDTAASAEANADASALLMVESTDKNADAAFKLGSAYTTNKKEVTVPVTLSGSYTSVYTKFRLTNGAKIKKIDLKNKDFNITTDGTGLLYAPIPAEGLDKLTDTKFDNEVVANIIVELPEDAVSGQSFQVKTKIFDGNTAAGKAVNPKTIESADIIYVLKGDTDLNNEVTQVDATCILREALSLDMNGKSLLPDLWEQDKTTTENEEVAATIANLGIEKLTAAVSYAVDSNEDSLVNPADATYILRYLLAKDMGSKDVATDSFDAYVASLNK